MDYRTTKLQEALHEVSPLARQKILATLKDNTVEIASGEWVKTLVNSISPNKKKQPTACGCLMMDGYLKEHPEVVQFEWNDCYDSWMTRRDVLDIELGDFDWINALIPYYEMENDEGAYEKIDHVARTYDKWVDSDPDKYLKKHRSSGKKVLSQAGRKVIIKLIEDIQ